MNCNHWLFAESLLVFVYLVKATERLAAVYPTLKEVALAGSPGSKAIKHLAQQILSFAIKAAGEGDVALM